MSDFDNTYTPKENGRYDIADILDILENSESFCQYKAVDIDDEDDQEAEEAKNFLLNNGIEFEIFRNHIFGDLNYSAQHLACTAYPADAKKILVAFYEN